MFKKSTRVLVGAVFLTALFGRLLLATVPGVWNTALGWAQEVTGPTKHKLVLPKEVKDYLARHPNAEAENVPPPADQPEDLLIVTQQKAIEEKEVANPFGDYEHTSKLIYVRKNYLEVTAKTESITISEVVGNRGNCTVTPTFETDSLPTKLKFGQTFKMTIDCEKLLEVEMQTDKGAMTFNWDK